MDQELSTIEKSDVAGFLREYQAEIQHNSGIPFSFKDIDLTIVPGGSVNVNYKATDSRGNELFLKRQLAPGGVYGSRLRREFLVLDFLSKQGLAANPFIYKEENKLLATSFIQGKKPSLEKDNLEDILVSIGDFLNSMRFAPITLLRKLYTGLRTNAKAYWFKDVLPTSEKVICSTTFSSCRHLVSFLQELIEILSSNLEDHADLIPNWEELKNISPEERPVVLVHNDFAFRNLIYTDSKIEMKAVDWETADTGDPAFDIGYIWSENNLTPEHVKIIAQRSCKSDEKGVKELMDRAYEFRPLIEVGNICWVLNNIEQREKREISSYIRSPYSIAESLNYTMYKVRTLSKSYGFKIAFPKNRLYGEIKSALKLIQTELLLLSN
ncbi:MAG: phosphotransferase [Candidatus Hodarchaeales archaeon]